MEQLSEVPLLWRTFVTLDLHEPHLGTRLQIVGCHPYLFLLHDALLVEVGLAPVDECEGIGLAIEFGKIQLLEMWWPVVVVLAGVRPSGPDEAESVERCLNVSSLDCRASTVAVSLVTMAARSAVNKSAIGGDVGGKGEAAVGERAGGGGDEERLDRDTKLSRASMPKTAGPRLRSS
jgi:hypothetical protein